MRRLHPQEPAFVRRNLGTRGLREAQRLRHAKVAAEQARWDRLRVNRPAGNDDIRCLAEAEMHRHYADLATRLLEVGERLDDLAAEAGAAMLMGEFNALAEAMLRREGFIITKDSIDQLAEKIGEARRLATNAWRTGMQLPDSTVAGSSQRARGMTLHDAMDAYLGELRRPGGAMSFKGVDQVEKSLRLLKGYVPDGTRIAEVTHATAGQFVADLHRLDPDYRRDPEAQELTLRQLVAKHPAGEDGGLAAATIRRHVTNVGGLWRWAEGRGIVATNPWLRRSLPKGEPEGHLPYTPDELRRLAAALPEATANVALAFRIALYSGMRLSEVAGIDAIVLDSPVPHFDLSGSRRKTKAGRRRVPIHPALLPYLQNVAPLDVDPKVLGNRFARWKAKAGVDRERTDFHSLRKNATEAMDTAGVAESDAALILGHASGRGFTFSVYSPNVPGMVRLQEAVKKINYPGLDLCHKPVPQRSASAEKVELNQCPVGLASPTGIEPVLQP